MTEKRLSFVIPARNEEATVGAIVSTVQVRVAGVASVVASLLINRTPRAESVMPRRLPDPDEPVSEYLTMRRGLFYGDGFIQTSTIMAPTELFHRVPFTVGLRRQQELERPAVAHAFAEIAVAVGVGIDQPGDERHPGGIDAVVGASQ